MPSPWPSPWWIVPPHLPNIVPNTKDDGNRD